MPAQEDDFNRRVCGKVRLTGASYSDYRLKPGVIEKASLMKRVLIVLGAIFGLVLVAAAAGIAYAVINGNALDKESQAYADATIPAIVQH